MATGQQSNRPAIRGAENGLDQLKFEVASEIGVDYQAHGGYGGDIPSRLNGAVGGHMVRRMIQLAEQQLAGSTLRSR
jgi:hypothetical protein